MRWPHFVQQDLTGVRFAVNVFIGSAVLWYLLRNVADTNPENRQRSFNPPIEPIAIALRG